MVSPAVAVVALAPSSAQAQFNNLWFFGDSNTDVFNATGFAAANNLPDPTPPPYAPGRFTNGPVWSENLARRFGVPGAAGPAWFGQGNNYAVGGATTGILGALNSPTGMLAQGIRFSNDKGSRADPNDLFVLWGGGNDLIDAMAAASPNDRATRVSNAANKLSQLAASLYGIGARNFLMPLLPNLGATPQFAGDATQAALARSLTDTFNQLLGASIQQLGFLPGAKAYSLNLDNLLTNIQIDAAGGGHLYGITNTTTPCFLLLQFDSQACDTAAFVDDRHPTTTVHRLIAEAAFDRVTIGQDVAVIPEPATVLLVAGGLALVGVVARRRRAA